MADAIVVFLIEKLTRLLEKEAKLLGGLQDEVTWLRGELKFMILFLNNSQGKRKEHDLVAEVVSQIRDVAHEAEDVIDTYIAHMIKQGRRTMVERAVVRSVPNARMLHDVAVKIGRIKTTVDKIFDNQEKYGIEGGRRESVEEAERIRKRRRDVEEEEVVGFEHDSRFVIDQLMAKGSRLDVVSIIGMGGLGKTTLAKKVYYDYRVKTMFPCRAWGYVSNDYRPREFFLSLLKCLLSTSRYNDLFFKAKETSEEELMIKVRECLNKSKYLVVVDDIWQTQVWHEIKGAFPDDCTGSRILITSRLAEVATASRTSSASPYTLPFLDKEQSWELLSKKVFLGEECPPDLEPLGKEIAESCDGLPLAIIVMAGILAKKNKSPGEWSRIKDRVNWHLGRDNTLKDILKLSYDNLPARLKPCFLYFGIYPEDYVISVKQLTRLWISEGFLIQETSTTPNVPEPEYIAEEYLEELVDRSLVQVVSRSNDGAVKTCQIHDLLRDLCISESRDDKFFEVSGAMDFQAHNSCPRRLSLHGTLFHFSSTTTTLSDSCISGTRSLLCFGQDVYKVKASHWTWLLKSFKLARVLDLGRMNVNSIPGDLGNLTHLRYLRICSYNLETIPASICRLWNLETLDLRGSPIKSFPSELWQLKHLRHLLMFGPVGLPEMPSDQSKTMPNLQTLSTVALHPRTASLLDTRRFPRLTKLGLQSRDKCNAHIQLQSLHRLSHLHKLKVIGTTDIPQNANVFPSNITKISLTKFGFFNSSALHTLGKLPNLQVLKLSSQTNDTSFDLHCATGGFLQLQVFEMLTIKVKRWRVDRGSMPRLRRLVLTSCKSLTELPKELWSMATLREVQVLWPCTELAKSLQKLVVKNGCKLLLYPLPLGH
ncbi:disease resistance protein RPP13 [Cajanus cajan]|uniref:Disease resistance protein RPP13 n=1 Tax=Cajanus cajan TaxID=3821 RepID=A0A151S7J3_CAJCA|nr:disease resistance protein RPP13 [Cajanus cajan]KYP50749.1 Disease resistance protein RPP13 [Cajanus cajan]